MKKSIIAIYFCFLTLAGFAQYKTDVLINGASAEGAAAAIQAARSGVKVILIAYPNDLLFEKNINFNIPAFDSGIWKEWKLNSENDSLLKISGTILEQMLKKEKNLQIFTKTSIKEAKEKKQKWELTILKNGEKSEISSKIIVNTIFNEPSFTKFTVNNPSELIVDFIPRSINYKLIRTSIATGFGKDSSEILYAPIGSFIPKTERNFISIAHSNLSKNLAYHIHVGQAVGALSAFAPFFKVSLNKTNVRTIQSEIINYKGQILPISDVLTTDSAFKAIQLTIASGLLNIDTLNAYFYPENEMNIHEAKGILTSLFPRAKIWFLENNVKQLNAEKAISLFSFISSREASEIKKEISNNWVSKYLFKSPFNLEKNLSRKEFAVLAYQYLKPYTVRVDFKGNYIQ